VDSGTSGGTVVCCPYHPAGGATRTVGSARQQLGRAMSEVDRVSVETIEVGQGGTRTLEADLYRPPEPNGAGVLLVHGGGFVRGDRRQLRGYGMQLGRLGYTSLACEYRLAPDNKWPAQLDDVHTALGRLHELSAGLGVDSGAIAVW